MTLPQSFQIDWAKQADAASLVPVMRALYAHDVPEAHEPDQETVVRHITRLLDPDTPHRLVIVRNSEDEVIGLAAFAKFTSISDPRPNRWTQFELKELFVLADYRSAGLGQALMDWVENEARASGACRIDWHVKADNVRGISFYKRFGGSVVENRISMRKSF